MKDDDAKIPSARVIHHTATRTRFRVDRTEEDPDYIPLVMAALEDHPSVTGVVCNTLTSTVLVLHDSSLELGDLIRMAETRNCFAIGEPIDHQTPIAALRKLYRSAEVEALRLSDGRLDMESIVLGMLLVSGVIGVMQGKISFPAATAAWYTMELIRLRSPDPGSPEHPRSPVQPRDRL